MILDECVDVLFVGRFLVVDDFVDEGFESALDESDIVLKGVLASEYGPSD